MSQTHIRGDPSWRGHFYLPFECGLCARPVKMRSLAYGLVSAPDSMKLQEITRPFVFPHAGTGSGGTGDMGTIVRIGDWAVGARYNVEPEPPGRCVECTVVHADCFKMYTDCAGSGADALDYLWFFTLWRQPWDRTKTRQSMRPLPREGFHCSKPAVCHVLAKLGMPDFATRLPWEIISTIFEFSRDAFLWKLARAATIAFQRRDHEEADIAPVRALEIESWKRNGASPRLLGPSSKANQLVRFTIDSQGINQIERIEKSLEIQTSHSVQDQEYLVAEEEELQSVDVVFKNGRARIRLPDGHPGFTTWDMLRPPPKPRRSAGLHDDLSDWVDNGFPLARMCGEVVATNRFQIAYTGGATGLTFIFDKNFLAHIHAHTPKHPIAELPHDTHVLKELGGSAMEQFSHLAWVYLPLPPGDKILSISFGTDGRSHRIRRPGMIVHTKLAGTVFIGYLMPISSPCIPLSEEPDVLFTRLQVSFVSGVGAYSTKPVSGLKYSDQVRNVPREMSFGQAEVFRLTSYAPLDDVVRLDIIEEPANATLRGLIFHYINGAQRAVGQFQIGHHDVKTYMRPACLCLRRAKLQTSRPVPQSIRATASPSCDEGHEAHTRAQGCACYPLTGFLRAQFDSDSISLRFATRDLRLADAMEGPVPTPPIFQPF